MKTLRKAIIAGAVLITAVVAMAKSVHVQWNSSANADFPVVTYNVYIYTNNPAGTGTNGAIQIVPVADTNAVVSNLVSGTTYWCNVDAQDPTTGLHSDLSDTISFAYPGAPMMLHIVP